MDLGGKMGTIDDGDTFDYIVSGAGSAGAAVAGEPLWPILRQPDQVTRAVRGEAVAAPKFDSKK